MATLDSDKLLKKLREIRQNHAWETVTKPGIGKFTAGEAYLYAVGHQSGLERVEKVIIELVAEVEKDFQ